MRKLRDGEGHDFLALEEADWTRAKTWALRTAVGLLVVAMAGGYTVGAWAVGLSRDVRDVRGADRAILQGLGRRECRADWNGSINDGIPCDKLLRGYVTRRLGLDSVPEGGLE